jgi:hypothetical protein
VSADEAEGKQGWLHREMETKSAVTNKDNNLAKVDIH